MLKQQFNELIEKLESTYRLERESKSEDYAKPDEDILANFKEVAYRLKGAPVDALTVWAVYLEKHIFAIERYIRDRKLSSETINGRLMDVVNYAYLGEALLKEIKEGSGEQVQLVYEFESLD